MPDDDHVSQHMGVRELARRHQRRGALAPARQRQPPVASSGGTRFGHRDSPPIPCGRPDQRRYIGTAAGGLSVAHLLAESLGPANQDEQAGGSGTGLLHAIAAAGFGAASQAALNREDCSLGMAGTGGGPASITSSICSNG